MAELATVRRADGVVADQAIGHGGHIGGTYFVRIIQSTMAGPAWVSGIQQRADYRAVASKIRAFVDGLGNYWGYVT